MAIPIKVQIDEPIAGKIREGKLIPVAFFFYNTEEDCLTVINPISCTKEEANAILKKFGCWPENGIITETQL